MQQREPRNEFDTKQRDRKLASFPEKRVEIGNDFDNRIHSFFPVVHDHKLKQTISPY